MGDPGLSPGAGPPPPPAPPQYPPPQGPQRNRSAPVVLIIAGALLVLALGILGGIVLTRDSGPQQASTSGSGAASQIERTTTVTSTENGIATTITRSVPVTTDVATADTTDVATGDDWGGGTGYTVFLASMRSYAGAEAKQQRADAAGLGAGILRTSDYSSLTPGYWGVFTGRFDSKAAAADRVAQARAAGFTDAYARLVAP